MYTTRPTMSINTLKRKANATKVATISNAPFSINGIYRNQGGIGQVSFFRPHDTTCTPEVLPVAKPSVLSTTGMIATKYRWIRRPAPYTTTNKPMSERTQSNYIRYLHESRMSECVEPLVKEMPLMSEGCRTCVSVPNMPRKTGAMSAEEYLERKVHCNIGNDFDENRQIIVGLQACMTSS